MKQLGPSRVHKRSVEIGGKVTSVSLEDEFWDQLRIVAASRGMTMEALINDVEASRTHANRTSALRIYALRWTASK